MIRDFESRHIGPGPAETAQMLKTIGVSSIDELIDQTIPPAIRLKKPMKMDSPMSEYEYLQHIQQLAARNKVFKTYIGLGYYSTITPSVILRNIFENPGWYTAYTPYQAEIAQGRLEALLNYQTMILDLTGMELANASLLDEATAAAEAMHMFFAMRTKDQVKAGANVLFVSEKCFPQTIDLLKTRSAPLGIELLIGNHEDLEFNSNIFGAVIQYPDVDGQINHYQSFSEKAKANNTYLCVCADLMSLVLLTPPGEWGADCVVGSSQRFGVPMGYGGPHAAYFATKEDFKRYIPGRIIGVSIDSQGNRALRMALQTREQHIKRDKATSNICTAQALLAIMASMYAVYHGPAGLRNIANSIHNKTKALAEGIQQLGYTLASNNYFDTLLVNLPAGKTSSAVIEAAEAREINLRKSGEHGVAITIDETTSANNLLNLLEVFAGLVGQETPAITVAQNPLFPESLTRKSEILTHSVFNSYHSETEMMRYIKKLENKDLALNHSMIALGSCTMKLNAATELMPLSLPGFANLHPFIPAWQAEGYHEIFRELSSALCEATGFEAVSLQPNSGAQGEYAGLMTIRAYHQHRGDHHRNIALIPSSAHGTNPASAVMAGMHVVVVACDEMGNVDFNDLRTKAIQHKDNLSCLMVTYPSTHGVFEEAIIDITDIIHENGGLVYMDGANMNAQVGLTSPGNIGADVCHLNLHKTFAIPHGGGGPGMGPIGVNSKLAPYLPGHALVETGGEKSDSRGFGYAIWQFVDIIGFVCLHQNVGQRRAYQFNQVRYCQCQLHVCYPRKALPNSLQREGWICCP